MKYKNITTEEDEQNKIYRIEITAETWEENEQLAKGMGIEYPSSAEYVELNFELKRDKE